MSRKKIEINPKCGERISLVLKEHKISQKQLADGLYYTQQQISRVVTGKDRLTEDLAKNITGFLKSNNIATDIRYEWLMCMDDFKTEGERIHSICSQSIERDEIINRLIELHGYKVALEKIFTSEGKDTEEDQLEADKKALAEWSGSSCHLRYPPGISDEDALSRIHSTYPEPIIRITAPVGPIICRFVEQCEYLRIVKDIDDYIEMRMSFLFRKHVDGATGYSGR